MTAPKLAQTQDSETEVAEELGVTIDQLRSLIKAHIVDAEEDLSKVPVATFQPSDLLLLKLLSGSLTGSAASH